MSNYLIRIDTGTAVTDSTIGLTSGVYEWAIGDEYDIYTKDVITKGGISALKRSLDDRTGGGNSQDTRVGVEIMGGKYTTIQSNADIVGKRIQIIKITWNGTSYTEDTRHTGVVTSVTPVGYKSSINIYLEGRNREVDLPYSSGAIGDVVVDGIVDGSKTYFKLNGYNVVLRGTDSGIASPITSLAFEGATPQNVSNIENLYTEMVAAAVDNNLYYEGQFGIYKITGFTNIITGKIVLELSEYNFYGDVSAEVTEVGTLFYSDEVYNLGVDGALIVEIDNNQIEIDDVNANIVDYNGGSRIDAGDGYVWKSLTNSAVSGDFSLSVDALGNNKQLTNNGWTFVSASAVYAQGAVVDSVSKVGLLGNLTDRTSTTEFTVSTNLSFSVSGVGVSQGFILDMKGYRFLANRLLAVVHFDAVTTTSGTPDTALLVAVTTILGEDYANPIASRLHGATVASNVLETYKSIPSTYSAAVTPNSVFDFYHPTACGVVEDGTEGIVIDLTDMLYVAGDGNTYVDDVDIYISAGIRVTNGLETTSAYLAIKQINLIEGYEVSRTGLADNKINIDNSAINGTIPLAYTDCIKRQNLFGINSTSPAGGWGTAQVQTDGNGNLLSSDYIMQNIPTGDLNGSIGAVSTKKLKSEIARSVPATAAFDKDGVETLILIGDFSDNLNEILYSDIEKNTLNIKAYEGRDIQPSLQFTFGIDKKRLQINNIEANAYSSTYVIDEIGLTDQQKDNLWSAGHALYVAYGLNTSQTVKNYPLINDAEGADRIATALYANMGHVFNRVYPRLTATFNTKKSVSYDIGTDVTLNTPQLTGIGKVTSFTEGVYGGTNAYACDVIDTVIPVEVSEILQTGIQTDNVLQTGIQTDDILQQGLL